MKYLIMIILALALLGLLISSDAFSVDGADAVAGVHIQTTDGTVITSDNQSASPSEGVLQTIVGALVGWLVEWVRHKVRRNAVGATLAASMTTDQKNAIKKEVSKMPSKAQDYLKKIGLK